MLGEFIGPAMEAMLMIVPAFRSMKYGAIPLHAKKMDLTLTFHSHEWQGLPYSKPAITNAPRIPEFGKGVDRHKRIPDGVLADHTGARRFSAVRPRP
jgi:hypothetical protein